MRVRHAAQRAPCRATAPRKHCTLGLLCAAGRRAAPRRPRGLTPLAAASSDPAASAGENVDLYIPRKCAWTNRLITAKDHASIQINIGHLDDTGVYTGQYTTLALSGFVRAMVRRPRPRALLPRVAAPRPGTGPPEADARLVASLPRAWTQPASVPRVGSAGGPLGCAARRRAGCQTLGCLPRLALAACTRR